MVLRLRFLHPRHHLTKYWSCAMAQGQAMSLLSRAYRLTRKQQYRSSALRALPALRVAVTKGGLRRCFFGNCARPFYEEYPTSPPSYVLNGFMFTLIGLYDLASIAPRSPALSMYQAGRARSPPRFPNMTSGDSRRTTSATRRWPGGSPNPHRGPTRPFTSTCFACWTRLERIRVTGTTRTGGRGTRQLSLGDSRHDQGDSRAYSRPQ